MPFGGGNLCKDALDGDGTASKQLSKPQLHME